MRVRRAWPRCRRWVCAVALAAALGAVLRGGADLSHADTFPLAAPAALAHRLADYSTHPHMGPWSVQDEAGNVSSWRYTVAFSCGARCAGEARVLAAARGAGRGERHVVRLVQRACRTLPLLPWPALCEEVEMEWSVSPAAAGSAVVTSARASCSLWRALSGACAAELRERRERLLALGALPAA